MVNLCSNTQTNHFRLFVGLVIGWYSGNARESFYLLVTPLFALSVTPARVNLQCL